MITVEKSDPLSPESRHLIEKLSAELASVTGDSGKSNFTIDSINEDRALWALARDSRGKAIGCGAIRPLTENIAELKRMFSDRSYPGIGNALLTFLEATAKSMGYNELWLETRHINRKAVNFYEKSGYIRIENYGPYIGREEAVCFAKSLQGCHKICLT
ncbi:GNAT family N-acetyltransferase [Pantoea sp. UBA4549]|uniref:GNAT family N-acetyltransferase n=1 Tax=Pantoea sp. UBA4549 TaxID=1947033 RepID=UPI0025F3A43F|nr:GNAT family N-acetyltransferase [Pantoea sp. UBA4549]